VREKAHDGRITALLVHGSLIYSAGYDGSIKVRECQMMIGPWGHDETARPDWTARAPATGAFWHMFRPD